MSPSAHLLFVLGLLCFLEIVPYAASQGTGLIPGYVCPQEDIDDTGCKSPRDCLYSIPKDCGSYIKCTDAGLAYLMHCENGLVFNAMLGFCDDQVDTSCLTEILPRSEFVCPPCNTPGGCLFLNPEDCASFYQCLDGKAFRKRCPEGLLFNVALGVCDWASETTCKPTNVVRRATDHILLPRVGFVCPVDDIANTGCQGRTDCLYPNPDNCNQFIQCEVNADGITGRVTVKDCPTGLEWNDNQKICDWPASSTCRSLPPIVPTGPPSNAVVDLYFSCVLALVVLGCEINLVGNICVYTDENNCRGYIACYNEVAYSVSCGAGTVFDLSAAACVSPKASIPCSATA